jgi:hypothetical protein
LGLGALMEFALALAAVAILLIMKEIYDHFE